MNTLSIITPHYNDALGVRKNLELLALKMPIFVESYIIVDDGSQPDCILAIKSFISASDYLKKLVIFYEVGKNKGANFCRRLGLRKCKSDYVMFLDSDDELSLDFFDNIYDYLQFHHYDFVFCKINYFKNGSKALTLSPSLKALGHNYRIDNYAQLGARFLFVDNFSGVGFQTSGWVIRRVNIRSNFWKIKLLGHQDWFFLMSFFSVNKSCIVTYAGDAVVVRNVYSNGFHISKKLDVNFSLNFLKNNISLFDLTSSVCFLSSVVSIKAIKSKKIMYIVLFALVFPVSLFRKSFWRYVYARLNKKGST